MFGFNILSLVFDTLKGALITKLRHPPRITCSNNFQSDYQFREIFIIDNDTYDAYCFKT